MKKIFILFSLFIFILLFSKGICFANYLSITSLTVSGQDTTNDTLNLKFTISWSNSWRDDTNYDAAWVFLKYSTDGGTTWSHGTLNGSGTNPTGFSIGTSGTALEIVVPSDMKGCFIQRSAAGTGSLSTSNVEIVWDYGASSVTDANANGPLTVFRIYGIEMVYIPTGAFYVGDGESGGSLAGQFEDGTTGVPKQIISENELILGGGGAGSLGNNNTTGMFSIDDFNDSTTRTLPVTFPKGYSAFYLMKYEISQDQYKDFLNTLTRVQQNTRTASQTGDYYALANTATAANIASADNYRNGIRVPTTPGAGVITFGCDYDHDKTFNETTDGQCIGCGYLSWPDVAAYTDWAALRPYTELEYEKVCRGPNYPILEEYSWGSTNFETATTSLTNSGTVTEIPNQGNANIDSCSPDGPYRTGSYADSTSTRENAGAGYYGNLDLTGNLYELIVTLGMTEGRVFLGTHGDGVLTTTTSYEGNATNTDWPGIDSTVARGVTDWVGTGLRGGAYDTISGDCRVSNRWAAISSGDPDRASMLGGRCARTAP